MIAAIKSVLKNDDNNNDDVAKCNATAPTTTNTQRSKLQKQHQQ